MAMPLDLVFVRHGQSESNLASKHAREGDTSLYTEEFRRRHNSQHRLTKMGRSQAKEAGEWLRKNGFGHFDRKYASDYVRAKETAGLLNLDGPDWYVDHMLRERETGELENLSWEERQAKEQDSMITRDTDPFYWIPPNGESIAQMTVRLRQLFDTLHRECYDKRVVVVCHGEVMLAFRQLIERLPLDKWVEIGDQKRDPRNRINNCQVIHYTRRNPETGELSPHLGWMRSVCPWDESLSSNIWQPIQRKRFSNEELLSVAQNVSPLFEHIKE
jgi:NAD+ kinase